MAPKPFTIAIAGNPNCGKTALFNALTGSRQSVGNWPGVTVEKKEGYFDLGARHIRVVDLPGTYAIFANSEDERAAVDFLLTREADLIVNIMDATNVERNMFLTSQLVDMQQPMVIAVNMMDIAEKRGLHIDLEALSKRFGVPAIPLSAVSEKSITNFISQMAHVISSQIAIPAKLTYGDKVESVVKELEPQVAPVAKMLDADPRWVSLMYLGNSNSYADKFAEAGVSLNREDVSAKLGEESEFVMADARYSMAHEIASEVIVGNRSKKTHSDKLDSILLNRWLALPIFLVVMYLVFWVAVTIGSAFIDFFDVLFGAVFVDGLGYLLSDVIGAPAWVTAILANGVGAGIQTVSTFIPVIFFMFLCLTFLEDSGYMARAAFVADRFMRFLGLPGRAFVPMMVGFGCGVPGIMGSRVLESKRERFLTIFLVPFMSCGARLPVYALFAAAFFGKQAGTIVFALYLVGILFAIIYGLFLKKSLFMGQSSNFVMELPNYHLPKLKSLLIHSWLKLKDYVLRAGKVITIAVAVLGFLNAFGYVDGKFTAGNADSENSLLSSVGKAITPVFEPFGVEEDNWPASVSLFTGLLAKEAVIGTMNSLYSMAPKSDASSVIPSDSSNITPNENSSVTLERSDRAQDVIAATDRTASDSSATPSENSSVTLERSDRAQDDIAATDRTASDSSVILSDSSHVILSVSEGSSAEPPAEPVAAEKPLIAGVDECPAEEEEDGAPDLKAAFIEAVSSIPANLSEVFGSLTDILGTSGELEAQSAA
ncbi:MAG: ferrous iron transport protein B, partial [Fibrobacter sp.]|nr:ferrous iron transport protein B [Fibrobacter sp.]